MSDSYLIRDEYDRQNLLHVIDNLAFSFEKPLVVSIEPLVEGPSAKQRRRHWAIMKQIAEKVWVDNERKFSAEAWHKYFCGLLIGYDELPDGTMVPMSSEKLKRKEYADMDEQIVATITSEYDIELDFVEQ